MQDESASTPMTIGNSSIFGSANRQKDSIVKVLEDNPISKALQETLQQQRNANHSTVIMDDILKIDDISQELNIGLQHTEKYTVMIDQHLSLPSAVKAEHVNVKELDKNNISIISTVMSQTVALDYYAQLVDRMLESFTKLNINVENTGEFKLMDHKYLHRLVASNNRIFTNVLSQLGIFEGSDAAWDNNDYTTTWDLLRKDFEIESRFKDLSLKLDIIKDNAKFFLEILHNDGSRKLEWIIIVLIAVEVGIAIGGKLV